MDSKEFDSFQLAVRQMIGNTQSGAMVWKKVNPTTYSWVGVGGHVLLQRASKTIRTTGGMRREVKGYLIQVLDQNATPQLTVNSTDDGSTTGILSELFDAVSSSFTQKGVDFLRSLVSGSED